jgi:hypothetical protein
MKNTRDKGRKYGKPISRKMGIYILILLLCIIGFSVIISTCTDGTNNGTDPETICDDGIDNDDDGLIDCGDPDCFEEEICEDRETICDDGIDNDANGFTDCDDWSCWGDPSCK